MSSEKVAVFLMALGGPDSLDNVEPYLLDLRGGRPTSPGPSCCLANPGIPRSST